MKLRAGLREVRERKGHWRSQRDVAIQVGHLIEGLVLPSLVSMWERGLVEPTEQQATAYAAVLGVGLSEVLDPAAHPDVVVARLEAELAALRRLLDDLGHALGAQAETHVRLP
jgi:hypothetical protein